jgi:hypothetical protein
VIVVLLQNKTPFGNDAVPGNLLQRAYRGDLVPGTGQDHLRLPIRRLHYPVLPSSDAPKTFNRCTEPVRGSLLDLQRCP